jgi:hypothetical protein
VAALQSRFISTRSRELFALDLGAHDGVALGGGITRLELLRSFINAQLGEEGMNST